MISFANIRWICQSAWKTVWYASILLSFVLVAQVTPSRMPNQWSLIPPVLSAHYYIAFDFLLEKPESFAKRQDFLQTSVLRNTMEQRISRLGQFINEAQWRFQLVSWNESTNNQKIKNSKKRLAKKIQQLVRTDARRKAEEGQDEGSDDTLQDGSGGETCFFNQLMSILTDEITYGLVKYYFRWDKPLKFQPGVNPSLATTQRKKNSLWHTVYVRNIRSRLR